MLGIFWKSCRLFSMDSGVALLKARIQRAHVMTLQLRYAAIITLLVGLTALSALPADSFSMAPTAFQGLSLSQGSSSSTNWSGYAVIASSGSVSDVRGSWVVPAIRGTCPSTAQYSSFWVGIDGYGSSTVEQTGTDSDCQGGAPVYYAWYEFYPHPSFTISKVNVHPGDAIFADVHYSSLSFTVTLTDVTTGQTFTTSSKVRSAQRSSAEWIAEAPSSSGGVLPLANFGTSYFGVDATGVASTSYAAIGGLSLSIGSFGSSLQSITMVTKSGAVKAQPSALSSDGTSFLVTWKSSGP
jgi:hypothetical protein